MDFRQNMSKNDAVFIPAGNWHNIMNVGKQALKLSVIYAPSNHPKGTHSSYKNRILNQEPA